METAKQAVERNKCTMLLVLPVLAYAHCHENQRDTHMILEMEMRKKWEGGGMIMIGQSHSAETSFGVEKKFGLVKVTAPGVGRFVLDELVLVMRHLVDRLSPLEPRRNTQLQRDLYLPGRSIAPTLERLDLRTWCGGHTRTVGRTVLARVDSAPEVEQPV